MYRHLKQQKRQFHVWKRMRHERTSTARQCVIYDNQYASRLTHRCMTSPVLVPEYKLTSSITIDRQRSYYNSTFAHRDWDRIVRGKFENEFTAGLLFGFVQRSDAAYHFDVALVCRHSLAQISASLLLRHQLVNLTLDAILIIKHIHLQTKNISCLLIAVLTAECRLLACFAAAEAAEAEQADEQYMNIN